MYRVCWGAYYVAYLHVWIMSLDTEYSISHFGSLLNSLYLVGQLLEGGWVETSRHLNV